MAHEGVQAQPVHIRFRPILTPTIQTTPHYAEALALGQVPPLGPSESAVVMPAGSVARRDRLGGLIYEYAEVA